MRRATGLVDISRRDFCAFAGGCLGLAIASCTDGSTPIVQTGALGPGGDDDNPPDAPSGHDASMPTDASAANMCVGAATDVGPASSFTTGTPKYFSTGKFFVVRDAGGLYA